MLIIKIIESEKSKLAPLNPIARTNKIKEQIMQKKDIFLMSLDILMPTCPTPELLLKLLSNIYIVRLSLWIDYEKNNSLFLNVIF